MNFQLTILFFGGIIFVGVTKLMEEKVFSFHLNIEY